MSLDKAIQHHKEHRRPYRGAKAVDPTCRNHGSDDWAKGNRLYGTRRREAAAESAIRDYLASSSLPMVFCQSQHCPKKSM